MVTSSIGSRLLARFVGLEQHARPADRQLEAFAAHGFDEHAQLQFAAACDFERTFAGIADVDRDIAFGFAHQAIADDAALHLVAFAAGQRRVIHRHGDGERRRIDRRRMDRRFDFDIAQRVGNGRRLEARDSDDVARFRAIDGNARKAAERQKLRRARTLDELAVAGQRLDVAVDGDGAALDAARQDAAEIGVSFERRDEHREGKAVAGHCQRLRRRHVGDDAVEQRRQAFARIFEIGDRPALAARGVEHMEIELVVVGFQRQEQVEDAFERFFRLAVRTIDLVDHHDRLQA